MPYSPVVKTRGLRFRTLRWVATAWLLAMLGACSSGPPPTLYLLEPLNDLALESEPPAIQAIGLAVTTLPAYANDARVASRDGRSRIVQDDAERWAEPPEEAITRVLAHRLREYADATILIEPWPRGFDPEARIEITFDKLLRESTGGAEMEGQIRVIAGDGRKVLAVQPFQLIHYGNGRELEAYFAAMSAGINDIARMTVEALREFF